MIHTDDQKIAPSLYKRGTAIPIGDVDFYPNNGISQPGCTLDDLDDLIRKMVSEGIKTFLSCSHFRAIDYFLESITDTSKCLHMAYECKSYDEFLKGVCGHCHSDSHLCSEMGYRANLYYSQQLKNQRKDSVKMYFATSKKRPFCCKSTPLPNSDFLLPPSFSFFPFQNLATDADGGIEERTHLTFFWDLLAPLVCFDVSFSFFTSDLFYSPT